MTNSRRPRFVVFPGFKATSCLTVVLLICLETVLLSTVSNCAKTFYMHWNTTNSIFRIDNNDHIIDVNKGNLEFEYDQVHIICPVYEPGTFDNETEKYIIYNVSKVEYETCRITNANPRIIAICDKPQKLMFFTITFRPFTPQPGGLEFLPGNDYYFISTSSKDDLHRRIGGRCSTNNMKVLFKVCCASDEQQQQQQQQQHQQNSQSNQQQRGHHSQSASSTSSSSSSSSSSSATLHHIGNSDMVPNGGDGGQSGISINRNIEHNGGFGGSGSGSGGSGGGGVNGGRLPSLINTNSSNVVQSTISWPGWSNIHSTAVTTQLSIQSFYPPLVTSPRPNGAASAAGGGGGADMDGSDNNNNINNNNSENMGHYPSSSHNKKSTKKTNEYDKHPNEVVKNEELTYNSGSKGTISRSSSNTERSDYITSDSKLLLFMLVITMNFADFINLQHCFNWNQSQR